MPRRARGRILYEGCYAHIYSRALDQRFIFREKQDFEFFKTLLKETKQEFCYRVHHYCLMNTHFHFVVSMGSLTEFSKALKKIKQSYAEMFQNKYKRKGPVWWGRFGSQLIESERYMYACGLYIELNPVKAGMVEKAEDWEYSSSRYYFLGQPDELVDSYERPSYDTAMELTEGLNVGRGSYIGTPLFLLNRGT